MKTSFKIAAAALMFTMGSAFTPVGEDGLSLTFGVSDSNPSQIELQLNDDYTFSYQDFSVPSEKIEVSGTYEIHKNTIQLKAADETVEFHDKWKISQDQTTANSRKGLTFYTLRIR